MDLDCGIMLLGDMPKIALLGTSKLFSNFSYGYRSL
jgi:hypothetical protein